MSRFVTHGRERDNDFPDDSVMHILVGTLAGTRNQWIHNRLSQKQIDVRA